MPAGERGPSRASGSRGLKAGLWSLGGGLFLLSPEPLSAQYDERRISNATDRPIAATETVTDKADVRLTLTNDGTITTTGQPAISVNSTRPEKNQSVFVIDAQNRGVLTVSHTQPTSASAALVLESLGGLGRNGGSHAVGSGGNGHQGGPGGAVSLVTSANITANDLVAASTRSGAVANRVFERTETLIEEINRDTGPVVGGIRLLSEGGQGGQGGEAKSSGSGGHGGAGGAGGAVDFTLQANTHVQTNGWGGAAIIVQSFGGKGGRAGGGGDGSAAGGGHGGLGGNGGSVDVQINGTVSTAGFAADALRVVSRGGGGGRSGGGGALHWGKDPAGGTGNSASRAEAKTGAASLLATTGEHAIGLLIQSIGGDGGDAASHKGAFVAVGATGGHGGGGETARLEHQGAVTTAGDRATGVHIQSVGGGGGQGGGATALGGYASIAVGGSGGGGGPGGKAEAKLHTGSSIITTGLSAAALHIQSIGGGGGNAGDAKALSAGAVGAFSFAIGGRGGDGGPGGEVRVEASLASILTTGRVQPATADPSSAPNIPKGALSVAGHHAAGILAQSIGGGGGNGGRALSVAVAGGGGDVPAISSSIAIGGSGGDGGDGGRVRVESAATITTLANRSEGIVAQSVGYGGGTGGSVHDISVAAAPGGAAVALNSGVGGHGGGGGDGGPVTLVHSGAITTAGSLSSGLLAQSIGGGGGNGGDVSSVAVAAGKDAFSTGINLGGSAGHGGTAGTVSVTHSGSIVTTMHQAFGAVVQSVAGGGGHGGAVSDVSVTFGGGKGLQGGKAMAANASVGGSGGSGGVAGAATFDISGSIETFGVQAHGALIQSIGGGGGTGGNVSSITAVAAVNPEANQNPDSATHPVNISVAVGGAGGKGGKAGSATFNALAGSNITTQDRLAHGVVVQSVGGGGGAGGHAHALAITTQLTTSGTDAAQSARTSKLAKIFGIVPGAPTPPADDPNKGIKGFGISATVSVGGKGGEGAAGAEAKAVLDRQATISTQGEHSIGVLVQSIGGGGGQGGGAHVDPVSPIGTYTASATIGGDGGKGNHGGTASFSDTGTAPSATALLDTPQLGTISTAGHGAHAIVAQSVGGGGGSGGTAVVGQLLPQAPISTNAIPLISKADIAYRLGGNGGHGGAGGAVSVARDGGVVTRGANAVAILAQSIGGGGGESHHISSGTALGHLQMSGGGNGVAGAQGGSVTVSGAAAITTGGAVSHGVLAQSIGGGGGHFAVSNGWWGGPIDNNKAQLQIKLGAGQSTDGDGGAVTINKTGQIQTSGNHAVGVLAQSLGGGGTHVSVADLIFTDPDSLGPGATIKGNGITLVHGASGAGGAIGITDPASGVLNVSTAGIGAHAILAQSVGGGGGALFLDGDIAMPAIRETGTRHAEALGGDVSVTFGGSLATTGARAMGILAQTASGGSVLVATGRSIDWSRPIVGASGTILIAQKPTGQIATSGEGAHGILALSDSAGRKFSPFDPGAHGIQLRISGTITTTGAGASAIRSFNGGTDFSAEVLKKLEKTTLHSTSIDIRAGARIDLGRAADGIATNTLPGVAIATSDTLALTNVSIEGTVIGRDANGLDPARAALSVDGQGVIAIAAGGSVTGAVLGQGGVVDLSVGGTLRGVAQVQGTYSLAAGGTHFLPVDFAPGRRVVSVGAVASLAGTLRPFLTTFASPQPVVGQEYLLLGSAQPFQVRDGLVANSLVTRFDVGYLGAGPKRATGIYLKSATVDFTGAPVAADVTAAARTANAMVSQWAAGTPVAAQDADLHSSLLAAAASTSPESVNAALRNLSMSHHATTSTTPGQNSAAILRASLSCGTSQGNFAAIREGDCAWGSAVGAITEHRPNRQINRDLGFAFGRQRSLGEDWRVGASFGYLAENAQAHALRSQGHRLLAGGTLKYVQGPWLAALAVTGSYGWADQSRTIALPAGAREARAERRSLTLGARLRLARLFEFGGLQVTPMLDLDAIHVHDFGTRERDAGAWNMRSQAFGSFLFDLHPSLRLGSDLALAEGTILRPYLEAGLKLSATTGQTRIRFHESSILSGESAVKQRRDRLAGTIGAGLSLFAAGGLELRASYSGTFSANLRGHAAALKLAAPF